MNSKLLNWLKPAQNLKLYFIQESPPQDFFRKTLIIAHHFDEFLLKLNYSASKKRKGQAEKAAHFVVDSRM